MTTAKELRQRARLAMQGKYWLCFAATLIPTLISYISSSIFSKDGSEIFSWLNFAVIVFITSPLAVGVARFFIHLKDGTSKIGDLSVPFYERYGNIVKIQLLLNVKIILWSLLFLIPGIVKSYEYAMIPYILAENPEVESKEAFAMSKQMMDGKKLRYFLLELSFIGWYLLGALAFGVGLLFVMPYLQAAAAEFYHEVK